MCVVGRDEGSEVGQNAKPGSKRLYEPGRGVSCRVGEGALQRVAEGRCTAALEV